MRRSWIAKPTAAALVALTCVLSACASSKGQSKPFAAPAITSAEPQKGDDFGFAKSAQEAQRKPDQIGLATWYGSSFAGKKTASGERFDPTAMTAAHRKLPFGTWVEVRRVDTGAVVRVRITDRGPWGDDRRIIDVSHAAAEQLGFVPMGSVKVELRVVSSP